MRKFIVTKEQLNEYVERKKSEKIFYDIVSDFYYARKNLNESISRVDFEQSIIENYKRKKLLTPKVNEMLIKYALLVEKREII